MLVTAQLDPAIRGEFDDWHARVHLPRVLGIPGIVSGRRLSDPSPAANYAMLYVFADDAALRTALGSAEANEAREDWQRWSDHIRDFTVHFYAEYEPPRLLNQYN